MSDRSFREPRPRGRVLYAEGPEISPNRKILSNFVKSAFLRNHSKPALFRGTMYPNRSREAPWHTCKIARLEAQGEAEKGYIDTKKAAMSGVHPVKIDEFYGSLTTE